VQAAGKVEIIGDECSACTEQELRSEENRSPHGEPQECRVPRELADPEGSEDGSPIDEAVFIPIANYGPIPHPTAYIQTCGTWPRRGGGGSQPVDGAAVQGRLFPQLKVFISENEGG